MSLEGSGENVFPMINLPGAPEQTYLFPKAKGHSRSVSHGGIPSPITTVARPSAIKSANRGHQRAFSHGQIGESARPGHSRTGSRTDFILPPGHRETPPVVSAVYRSSFAGHSRQASRTDSVYTLRRNSSTPPWRRAILWMQRKEQPSELKQPIIVVPNHIVPDKTPKREHPNGKRCDNKVRTTKYTLLSFIPKNLLEQFHRVANLYFIFIVLLNWVPELNAIGKQIAMLPVLFVLCVTAIKDLCEDRRRYLSDKRINNEFCRIYKKSLDRYISTKWKNVRVGDIVHLSNNEAVPADMVLLRSADAGGVCYLDTCNLDGETNLKQRFVAPGFKDKFKTFTPSKFVSVVEVDQPSTKIYRFHGSIVHPDGTRTNLSSENILLRECTVKNTDFVEGIVVYAGHETKAMLNNSGPRYKRSSLETSMNKDVVWCILLLLLLCCIGAIGCKIWLSQYAVTGIPFIVLVHSATVEALLIFWTYVIVLQVLIPLSLYVTIEMTKVLQIYHIHQDIQLYDRATNTRMQCRALNITEELGQIQYVFSDKTGTLTENKMLFKRCTIDGNDYDHPPGLPPNISETLPPIVTPITNVSPNPKLLHMAKQTTPLSRSIREFLLVLSVCNTVMVGLPHEDTMTPNGSQDSAMLPTTSKVNGVNLNEKYARLTESRSSSPSPSLDVIKTIKIRRRNSLTNIGRKTSLIRYEAESPDELALADAAFAYGFEIRKRTADSLELGILGEATTLEILRVQEFDSVRKCMSIAIRASKGQVLVYAKGADTTMLNLLAPTFDKTQVDILEKTKQAIDEYSRQGLRTLVFARRTLTLRQWEDWESSHSHVLEGPSEGRERRIRDSYMRLETGMRLLGATGVEDRLQEEVPQTIKALIDAGVIVWVLTGDKPETAINVAYAASVFSLTDKLIQLIARDKNHAERLIKTNLKAGVGGGLVVDGRTLTYILDRRSGLVTPFLELARRCSAVLCCRATPLQKAYIVKAVKEELGVTTLAIGDGANDVSMIQIADVGIGLSGQEGRQAVMSSDFAMSQFKYLRRVLLVHGHWCYDRLSRMILYFFLKNATFVFMIYWFQLYNGFSASVMVEQIHFMLYNLVFTAIPPIAIGAYDRNVPSRILMSEPHLYNVLRTKCRYSWKSFWFIIVEGLYISLVIFFMCLGTYWDTTIGIWQFGLVNMSCCIFTMIFYVAVETRSWTIIHIMALITSILSFYVVTFLFHTYLSGKLGLVSTQGVSFVTLQDYKYWALIVITTVLGLLPRVTWYALRNSLCPGPIGLAVIQRKRKPNYAAHYHSSTHTTHLYRSTPEESFTPDPINRLTTVT